MMKSNRSKHPYLFVDPPREKWAPTDTGTLVEATQTATCSQPQSRKKQKTPKK